MYCGNANERQDAGSDHSSAAKGSSVDLGVAALVQLAAVFPFSSFFIIM